MSGGSGGSGPRGGGGGSAGRLTANRVVDSPDLFFGTRGTGGAGSQNCDGAGGVDNGGNGFGVASGDIVPLGTDLDRAAVVYLDKSTSPGPFVKGTAKLLVKGVQDPQPAGDGHMDIVVCRKYLDPEDTVAPFEDPGARSRRRHARRAPRRRPLLGRRSSTTRTSATTASSGSSRCR